MAHVQHIVDQVQQMVPGGHDLLEVTLHLVRVLDAAERQCREADDRVHRCPDVVRHIGEEYALCLVGAVCLDQCILQDGIFLHLAADLLVDAVEAEDDPAILAPVSGADGLHLEIAELIVAVGAVIDEVGLLLGEPLHQVFAREGLPHHILILLVDTSVYVACEAVFHGQFPRKKLIKYLVFTLVDPQGISSSGVQVKEADEVVIDTQRMDQLQLAFFTFLPLGFLVKPLRRTVKEEALVEQFPVFLHELDISHDVQQISIVVLHAVCDIDAVTHILQGQDAPAEVIAVLCGNGRSDHVKTGIDKVFLGLIAEDLECGAVHAEDPGAVDRVAQDTAVHRGEQCFQCLCPPCP